MSRGMTLRGDEAELFEKLNGRLVRSIARAVRASDDLVEDACSIAWTILFRCQPERGPELFGWLRRVALHEAYRLARVEQRDHDYRARPQEFDRQGPAGLWCSTPPAADLETQIEAREALRVVSELPARQRRYLAAHVAGHRYHEITALHDATHTNVNKHLTRARANVRRARAA